MKTNTKLPLAQAEREPVLRAIAAKLLASLPAATLTKSVRVIRVGAEFPEWMRIDECLEAMSKYPHMEYDVCALSGSDNGRSLVDVLAAGSLHNYRLISTKGTRAITGTEQDAIRAAIAMENELQPAFGVTIEDGDGETVTEVRDGEVTE